LGYHSVETWEKPQRWGLAADQRKIWLPPGIVFPWLVGSELWRISIRRVGDTIGKAQRYVVVSGSSNTLYGLDTLKPNAPAVITEGAFNGLTVLQEAGDLLGVVATGSTTGGRLLRWIGRLSLASTVLVAFGADDAGDAAAAWWLKALGTWAKGWRPYWGDPSQLLQDGADVRTWVVIGLGISPIPPPATRRPMLVSWPDERREAWEERAAIMEYEGGLRQREAEREAFARLQETV
jgi:DNA primase